MVGTFRFWLGPERGLMPIDSELLLLRVAGGRVVEARLAVG